jgi:hypothetical protein
LTTAAVGWPNGSFIFVFGLYEYLYAYADHI